MQFCRKIALDRAKREKEKKRLGKTLNKSHSAVNLPSCQVVLNSTRFGK